MKDRTKGYELLFGNILVLTIFYLGVDFVLRIWNISVEQTMFWGWTTSMLFVAPFFLFSPLRRTALIKEWKLHKILIVSLGILSIASTIFFLWGIDLAGSGPASLFENTQMIFAVLLGVLFLGEKFVVHEIWGALLMLGGIFLIANLKGEVSSMAAILITIASFFYALQSFLFKKYGKKVDVMSFAYLRGCVAGILIIVAVFSFGKYQLIPYQAIFVLGFIYVLGILVARYMFFHAHRYLEISKLNIFLLLQPVGILLGAFFLFGDPLSLKKIIGAVLILGGGFFLIRARK